MKKTSQLIAEQAERSAVDELVNSDACKQSRKQPRRKEAHLVPFQWPKGVSGNPSGRPKKDYGRIIAQAALESCPEYIAGRLYDAMAKGNAYTFKELCDRAYGKVSDKVELTGRDGGPLEYRGMSEQDLDARIKQLEVDLGYANQIDSASAQEVKEIAGAKQES